MATVLYISKTSPPTFLSDKNGFLLTQIPVVSEHATINPAFRFEFILIDISDKEGLQNYQEADFNSLFQPLQNAYPAAKIILLTKPNQIHETVRGLKAGADSYLLLPIIEEELNLCFDEIKKDERSKSELEFLRDKFWTWSSYELVTSRSPKMQSVLAKVKAVAPTKTTVLLTGESGTGKGVIAKLIHQHSERADSQFLSLHCGAIPETLIESELFGHEKGSFTGADRRKLGCFEMAKAGTLFLDEIGTVSKNAQIKLLQVLQERIFRRIGGAEQIESNVRIVAATNENLKELVENKAFREDLYYRLNVFQIELPPLRERLEDLEHLIQIILKRLSVFNIKNVYQIHPEALAALKHYHWPGNIRELENIIERAFIIEPTDKLTPDSFPSEISYHNQNITQIPMKIDQDLASFRQEAIEKAETQYLIETLAKHKGKIKDTALAANISTRQLHKLLTKYHINKSLYKLKEEELEGESSTAEQETLR